MSARKRKAEDNHERRSHDEDMSRSPQSSPSISSRPLARASKRLRNSEIRGRPLVLPRLLETLDADSLRNVLQAICNRHPDIGEEVVTTAPRPTVESALVVLNQYSDRLQQALPIGSNRANGYAFDRVQSQLRQLIDAIVDFVPHYLPPNEAQATSSLEFLEGVTNVIHNIPDWENPGHRYYKDNAYDEISKAWALVINEASKRGAGFQLHTGNWDRRLQQHNQQSGGKMQEAVNALGSNLGWMGSGGQPGGSSNEGISVRDQLLSGTYGVGLPVHVGPW
jgi:hypothetical protein